MRALFALFVVATFQHCRVQWALASKPQESLVLFTAAAQASTRISFCQSPLVAAKLGLSSLEKVALLELHGRALPSLRSLHLLCSVT